jgi:hypothetical protein
VGSSLWGGSALQNIAIPVAIADLNSETSHVSSPTWQKVIAALMDYGRLPDTGFTAALNARASADSAVVNAFFHATPDAMGCFTLIGPEALKAMRAWDTEPTNTTHGVRVAPLRRARTDLKHGLSSDKADTACCPAAIADLQGLDSATPSQIAASSTDTHQVSIIGNLDGYRIAYLNAFFFQFNTKNFSPVLAVQGE